MEIKWKLLFRVLGLGWGLEFHIQVFFIFKVALDVMEGPIASRNLQFATAWRVAIFELKPPRSKGKLNSR